MIRVKEGIVVVVETPGVQENKKGQAGITEGNRRRTGRDRQRVTEPRESMGGGRGKGQSVHSMTMIIREREREGRRTPGGFKRGQRGQFLG